MTIDLFSALPLHAALWDKINTMITNQRVAQAMLFVGPRHAHLPQFANRFAAMLLCKESIPPCGKCRACHLMQVNNHPDFTVITPEKEGGMIKVDQIRALQQAVFNTPQLGARKIVLITNADKMNRASANALLKILEEPPQFLHFILLVEQLDTVPATVLSRCQKLVCSGDLAYLNQYLLLGEQYTENSTRAKLHQQHAPFMQLLCDVVSGRESPCVAASAWADYALDDLMWYLYLVIAQSIRFQLLAGDERLPHVMAFSQLTSPVALFALLAKINEIRELLTHNITINQTLAIEDLLIRALP